MPEKKDGLGRRQPLKLRRYHAMVKLAEDARLAHARHAEQVEERIRRSKERQATGLDFESIEDILAEPPPSLLDSVLLNDD